MHPKLVKEIVEACEQREKEGDRPVTQVPCSAVLQDVILYLACETEQLKAVLKARIEGGE